MHACTLRWSLLHSAPPAYDLVHRRPALLPRASSPCGTAQLLSSPSFVTVRYPGHSSAMPRTIRAGSRRHGPCHAMIASDRPGGWRKRAAQGEKKCSSLLHAISLLSTRASRSAHSRAHVDSSSLPFPAFLFHRAIKKLETTVLFHFPSLHRLASKQCLFSASLTHTQH